MKFNLKKYLNERKDKIKIIKEFALMIIGYGILINYAMFVIFKFPFTWYSSPAYGIVYYLITEEFVTFYRKLRARIYG
jgi:hypothetical protein